MTRVFICYRREDSEGQALALFKDLSAEFGRQRVFFDVVASNKGRDFRRVISDNVNQCDAALVVIGPKWLEIVDSEGRQRLSRPDDFVRLEVLAALQRDVPVIPVLVRGARMPSPSQVPEDLRELVYRDGVELTHARWDSDVAVLIAALKGTLKSGGSRHAFLKWRAVGLAAGSAAILGVGVALLRPVPVHPPEVAPAPAPTTATPPAPAPAALAVAAPPPAPPPATSPAPAPTPARALAPAPPPPARARTNPQSVLPPAAATAPAPTRTAEPATRPRDIPVPPDAAAERRASDRDSRAKALAGTSWIASWECPSRVAGIEISEHWIVSFADATPTQPSAQVQAFKETVYSGRSGEALGSDPRRKLLMPSCRLVGSLSSEDDRTWRLGSQGECRVVDGGSARAIRVSFALDTTASSASLELVGGSLPCSDSTLRGTTVSMQRK